MSTKWPMTECLGQIELLYHAALEHDESALLRFWTVRARGTEACAVK